ncbi:MAG: cation:proton antiporter [Candidatus Bruticola sp.]
MDEFSLQTANNLLFLAVGAFFVPLLCRPLRLPASIGEILYGILVGPYVMKLVHLDHFCALIGELGFFLLLFNAGLELNFHSLETSGRRKLMSMAGVVALIFVFSYAAVYLFNLQPFVVMIIAATSIGLPIMLLQETGQGKKPFGQQILVVGTIGEFICIVAAAFIAAWNSSGGLNAVFAMSVVKMMLIFALAYFMLVVLRSAVWWHPEYFSRMVAVHDPSEIGVRAGMALMFMMVAAAIHLGVDAILGAFMAGALFSCVFRAKGPLEMKFLSLANGFFVPVFFIRVGLEFKLDMALKSDWRTLMILFLSMLVVRLIACLLCWTPSTHGWSGRLKESLAASLILAAPLTLLVVFGSLGLKMGVISESFNAAVILLAVVSSIVWPFLFKMCLPWLEEKAQK